MLKAVMPCQSHNTNVAGELKGRFLKGKSFIFSDNLNNFFLLYCRREYSLTIQTKTEEEQKLWVSKV
jgi:hypothetical protein